MLNTIRIVPTDIRKTLLSFLILGEHHIPFVTIAYAGVSLRVRYVIYINTV